MGLNSDPPLRPPVPWLQRGIEQANQDSAERLAEAQRQHAQERAGALAVLGFTEESLALLQQLAEKAPQLFELLNNGSEDV